MEKLPIKDCELLAVGPTQVLESSILEVDCTKGESITPSPDHDVSKRYISMKSSV